MINEVKNLQIRFFHDCFQVVLLEGLVTGLTKGTGQGPQRRHPAWVCLRSGSEGWDVACGFTTRVLPTFLDTKPGNEAELVAHCTDELPVVGTHTRETPGNSLV